MHKRRLLGLSLLMTCASALGQGGNELVGNMSPKPAPAPLLFAEAASFPPQDKSVSQPTIAALDKPIDKFVLENVPFDQALEQFVKVTHINADINWKAIEESGVSRHTPIAIQLSQVPARKVLSIILSQGARAAANLHFLVTDNTLAISTGEDLSSQKYQVVVVYDLRPLFADVEFNSKEAAEIERSIVEPLETAIDHSSWRDNGGAVGYAKMFNGMFIVNQSMEAQEQIAAYILSIQKNLHSATRLYDVRDLVKDDLVPAEGGTSPNRMDALINTLETSCGRGTWRGRGGNTSSIAAFDGKVYVTTNSVVHQQIEQLLAMMRKKD